MQRNSESVSELCKDHLNALITKKMVKFSTFPLPVLPTEKQQVKIQVTTISWTQESNLPIPILSPDLTWKERSCSTFGPV
jgi:hypothetical protein